MPEKKCEVLHAPVLWAQRSDRIYVTINVESFKPTEFKIEGDKLTCKGVGGAAKHNYSCELQFYGEVDGEKYTQFPGDRSMALMIPKKTAEGEGEGKWWPRLLKESGKVAWLKTDFNRWKDEDESDDEENAAAAGPGGGAGGFDLQSMMSGMGGMGGMPGMGGMGGMGGMPGMGGMDFGGDDDSDAEDLPDLEDPEEEEAGAAKTEGKPEHTVTPSTSGEVA